MTAKRPPYIDDGTKGINLTDRQLIASLEFRVRELEGAHRLLAGRLDDLACDVKAASQP